jgi:hypothetical protein
MVAELAQFSGETSGEAPFSPGVVVLEKTSWWEAELKRAFWDDPIQVRACRLPAQVPPIQATMSRSILIVQLDVGLAACLRLIVQTAALAPAATAIALAPRAAAELEWPAREFGAAEFLLDTVSGQHLARLCRRLLGGHAGIALQERAVPLSVRFQKAPP